MFGTRGRKVFGTVAINTNDFIGLVLCVVDSRPGCCIKCHFW